MLRSLQAYPGVRLVLVSNSQVRTSYIYIYIYIHLKCNLEYYVSIIKKVNGDFLWANLQAKLVPILAKVLLFGLAEFFPGTSIFSSANTRKGRRGCTQGIQSFGLGVRENYFPTNESPVIFQPRGKFLQTSRRALGMSYPISLSAMGTRSDPYLSSHSLYLLLAIVLDRRSTNMVLCYFPQNASSSFKKIRTYPIPIAKLMRGFPLSIIVTVKAGRTSGSPKAANVKYIHTVSTGP